MLVAMILLVCAVGALSLVGWGRLALRLEAIERALLRLEAADPDDPLPSPLPTPRGLERAELRSMVVAYARRHGCSEGRAMLELTLSHGLRDCYERSRRTSMSILDERIALQAPADKDRL